MGDGAEEAAELALGVADLGVEPPYQLGVAGLGEGVDGALGAVARTFLALGGDPAGLGEGGDGVVERAPGGGGGVALAAGPQVREELVRVRGLFQEEPEHGGDDRVVESAAWHARTLAV